jgi:chemotaxis protein methyltransferase CheR
VTLAISSQEFMMLRRYIEEESGIYLGDDKSYLVENRLSNLAREYGCSTFGQLYCKIAGGEAPRSLKDEILDAISTNETQWFRDAHPFRVLEHCIMPRLIREVAAGRRKRIAVWSAACSTGQEPYSIAMTALNSFAREGRAGEAALTVRITASDVSRRSLGVAEEGVYSESAMKRGMSPMYLYRHFRKEGSGWRISRDIREMVSFERYNLKAPPPRTFGSFDVVFLRNVIIYFSDKFKRELFGKVAGLMSPGGYLFLGTSETVNGYTDAFETLEERGNIFYRVIP